MIYSKKSSIYTHQADNCLNLVVFIQFISIQIKELILNEIELIYNKVIKNLRKMNKKKI